MRSRGTLEAMKLTGTVKNGVVAVDLPDGVEVVVEIDWAKYPDRPPGVGPPLEYDADGNLIMTPELEAALAAGEAEADAGLGIPAEEVIAELLRER